MVCGLEEVVGNWKEMKISSGELLDQKMSSRDRTGSPLAPTNKISAHAPVDHLNLSNMSTKTEKIKMKLVRTDSDPPPPHLSSRKLKRWYSGGLLSSRRKEGKKMVIPPFPTQLTRQPRKAGGRRVKTPGPTRTAPCHSTLCRENLEASEVWAIEKLVPTFSDVRLPSPPPRHKSLSAPSYFSFRVFVSELGNCRL